MKHIQRAILCLALISGSALGGPFEAGLSALDREHYATAMRAWLKLANEGAAEAQNNIGHLYEQGFGVSQNYTEAMNWYRKAADQGLAEAQHNMGMLYYHGYGVAENQRTAASWFKRAALQDLVDAEYMLGLAYHEGKGVELNYQLAKHWFKKGALKAYGNAQFMYAYMLQSAQGGDDEPEAQKAMVWAALSEHNGKTDAISITSVAAMQMEDREISDVQGIVDQCLATNYAQCPE